jgi:benzoyl-CoA reductase/2-hydroxyglutaryl-CoA dehydratase subunit BcrC/BadD/HgdB
MDPIPEKPIPRPGWYDKIYDQWDEFYDSDRLDLRVKEVEALIAHLEVTTGKTFSIAKLNQSIDLFNEQMEYWEKADELIAYTRPCPVGWRDSQAVHQAKWHRGTVKGRDFLKAYYEEVKERIDKGEGVVPEEKVRLLGFFPNPPAFSQYLAEKYGAVFIGSTNSSAHCYRRKVLNNDPIRALAARQMAFSFSTPDVDMRYAKEQKVDGVIEDASMPQLSHEETCKKENIPFLKVSKDEGEAENRVMLDEFMKEVLSRKN